MAEYYYELKLLHVGSAVLSFIGFFVRGIWMMISPEKLDRRWVKKMPHVVDTILLVSALLLAVAIQHYPFQVDWLTVKVIALIAYILLGMVALHYGRTKAIRTVSWVAALTLFLFIVSVAHQHHPAGLLVLLM